MQYHQYIPQTLLSEFVKCIWWIDSEGDARINRQKIVPDGYPEVIIHYGDAYKINISGNWEVQEKQLLAGQIKNHFFLENTGKSNMVGIKFQPTALFELFGIDMSQLVDKVVPIDAVHNSELTEFALKVSQCSSFDARVECIERWLGNYLHKIVKDLAGVKEVVGALIEANGNVSLNELLKHLNMGERTLERQFKKQIGLSPKFYSRIIRFTYIFEQIKKGKEPWLDITFDAGFYDQAHFIKNFKEFTGERPSSYGFDENNMANFFLHKE